MHSNIYYTLQYPLYKWIQIITLIKVSGLQLVLDQSITCLSYAGYLIMNDRISFKISYLDYLYQHYLFLRAFLMPLHYVDYLLFMDYIQLPFLHLFMHFWACHRKVYSYANLKVFCDNFILII